MPETLEELNLLLLTVATPRKVRRDRIHCHGLRYLASTFTAYVGEEVTVRYDLAEIRVFHQNQFLRVAVSPELAASNISLKDLQTDGGDAGQVADPNRVSLSVVVPSPNWPK